MTDLIKRLEVGDDLLLRGSTIKTRRGLVTSSDRLVRVAEITRSHIKFTDGGGWNLSNPEPWPFLPITPDIATDTGRE